MVLWKTVSAPFVQNIYGWMTAGTFTEHGRFPLCMDLQETVDYLAEELDLERSEHVREVGRSVGKLRD